MHVRASGGHVEALGAEAGVSVDVLLPTCADSYYWCLLLVAACIDTWTRWPTDKNTFVSMINMHGTTLGQNMSQQGPIRNNDG